MVPCDDMTRVFLMAEQKKYLYMDLYMDFVRMGFHVQL